MKQTMLASGVLFVLACRAAYGQGGVQVQLFPLPRNVPPQEIPPRFDTLQEEGRYLAVKDFMRYPRPLPPVGDFTLWAMGDEIASYFNLILERRPPLSTEDLLRVLDMIHTAFKRPAVIRLCSDRNPEKSLALLETLQEAAMGQFDKESIAAEASFLATFIESATPTLSNLPCNPGSMREDVDLSVPANDLPSGAIVDLGPAARQDGRAFPTSAIQARFATVSAYMRLSSPLQLGDRYLAALGDDSAFFVYSFMANNPPLSAGQMLTALDIIHKSFVHPMAIQGGAARKPKTSLALLKMLKATAVDQTVKECIASEMNFLNDVPKKIYAPWMGIPDPPIRLVTTP
jgi:hypothetical protein